MFQALILSHDPSVYGSSEVAVLFEVFPRCIHYVVLETALGLMVGHLHHFSPREVEEAVHRHKCFAGHRSQRIFQTRTLLDSGVMIAWGSDWDVTGVSPLDGLETATTHRYPGGIDLTGNEDSAWIPEERISLEQAIVAYTSAAAYLMHADSARGSLSAGKLADFVVLSSDPTAVPVHEIKDITVRTTVVGGRIVYEGN